MQLYDFLFPDLGEGVHEGEIVRWLVAEGDRIAEDQDVVEVMTDKVTPVLPSPRAGIVHALHGKAGDIVEVGRPLLTIETADSPVDARANGPKISAPESRDASSPPGAAASPSAAGVRALPGVRQLARELNVDLSEVAGSGGGGRVLEEDVHAHAARRGAAGTHPGAPERIPLRGVRRELASHLVRAKRDTVPCTLVEECEFTALSALRESLRVSGADGGVRLTYLPFVIAAVSRALLEHPGLNARVDEQSGDLLVWRGEHHISVAVQTDAGLVTPVVRNVERRGILDLAGEISRLADAARAGTLTLADVQGGGFTVSSPGRVGGLMATPVLNAPQVGTLALHRIEPRAVIRDGQVVGREMANFSLTFDHRYVDGLDAGGFLQSLVSHLQEPANLNAPSSAEPPAADGE